MDSSDPDSAIRAQLVRLRIGLNTAAKQFNPGAEDHGRQGVLLALFEFDFFLKAMFGNRTASIFLPLNQLRYALFDLERGKTVPLLTQKKIKHRPRDSSAKEAFRALAAVAMELFIKGKIPRNQAAKAVAKALSATGYENSIGKPITAKLVEDWRDRMKKENPKEYAPAGRFHRMVPQLESMFPNDPKSAAKYLLDQISALIPPDIPKKLPA